jgi:transcriptional regulator with XRE-family HTH domain
MAAFRFSGGKLRACREREGLTRKQLGEGVERGESAITLYELDYRTPPMDVLVGMATVLGVRVEDLFDAVDEVRA